ncbi:MAG: PCRF domain-containing protein, partial [Clostridiales bacterium]|nr:PCRF domain-containing protein [Clostridiales bacterium]
MIGKELSDEAGLSVGDKTTILTPVGKTREVTISGIYDLKVANINKSWAIAEIKLVQDIFEYGDKATSIEMQVGEVFKADTTAESLAAILPEELKVQNWKAQNEALLDGAEREFKLRLLPRDPTDDKPAVVEIRAGTGGDEAGLFVADVF